MIKTAGKKAIFVQEIVISPAIGNYIISQTNISIVQEIMIMDKVTCAICGKKFGKINFLHLRIHRITTAEYINKYPDSKLTSDDVLRRMNLNRVTPKGKQHYMYGKKVPRNVRDKISAANSGKNNYMYGKNHSDETKIKISKNHADVRGKNNPNYGGKYVTDEWRQKQCEAHKGQIGPFTGRKHTDEAKNKVSVANSKNKIKVCCGYCGKELFRTKNRIKDINESFCSRECMAKKQKGKHHPSWKGGLSFEPYCIKFNNTFKESIRDMFDRKCFLCDKSEVDNGKKLCIHHVNYDKNCLCDDSKCEFVPLCNSCHSKTNFNRSEWEQQILDKLGVLN